MNQISGFLVVLAKGSVEYSNRRNPAYRGISRIPTYPSSVPEESVAIDQYVFELRDDSGLIRSQRDAEQLVDALRASPRRFEVLQVREITSPTPEGDEATEVLGYDVCTRKGEFWSIVQDMPDAPSVSRFLQRLNADGLFQTADDAMSYLSTYQTNRLVDSDMPFGVFRVAEVPTSTDRAMKLGA